MQTFLFVFSNFSFSIFEKEHQKTRKYSNKEQTDNKQKSKVKNCTFSCDRLIRSQIKPEFLIFAQKFDRLASIKKTYKKHKMNISGQKTKFVVLKGNYFLNSLPTRDTELVWLFYTGELSHS